MRHGGPRGAIEALYALQVEEANALRADMRGVVEEIRAHHARYQEMAALRATADHQIIEAVTAVAALADFAKALDSLACRVSSTPERVQAVLNPADVTELHRRIGEALTVDVWARLGTHADAEAKRFADIATRIENNVDAAVRKLRDANAGRPSLPTVITEGKVSERLWSRARYYCVRLLHLSGDLQPLAVAFAGVSIGLTAITILVSQLLRMPLSH